MRILCHIFGGEAGWGVDDVLIAPHSWTDYKATPIQTASFPPVKRGKKETHSTSGRTSRMVW